MNIGSNENKPEPEPYSISRALCLAQLVTPSSKGNDNKPETGKKGFKTGQILKCTSAAPRRAFPEARFTIERMNV